jgi:hypothetical protein
MSTLVGGEDDLGILAAIVSQERGEVPKMGCRCRY